MKIVQINAVCGIGSTGEITVKISKMLNQNGIENYILYSYGTSNYEQGIKCSGYFDIKLNAILAKVLGNYGFNSHSSTKKIIQKLEEIKPDIVHLHNIHGHNVNLKMLFKYLKKINVRVIWTFHDCWAFTGYCMHFDNINCNKWETQCKECPQAKNYSLFADRSTKLFNFKKSLFTEIEDMTIITPSKWMASLVKKSYMSKFPVEVINNGTDLNMFYKRNSDIKQKYNIQDKFLVLGIQKENFDLFLKLAEKMDDNYRLLLVGLSSEELEKLPENVIGMSRIQGREEMAEIFSACDAFVNLTLQDTFPTVNLEALACGTPVVTFNTGGSPESVDNETGFVVQKGNVDEVYEALQKICNGPDKSEACIKRAKRLYNANERGEDYLNLYLRKGKFE